MPTSEDANELDTATIAELLPAPPEPEDVAGLDAPDENDADVGPDPDELLVATRPGPLFNKHDVKRHEQAAQKILSDINAHGATVDLRAIRATGRAIAALELLHAKGLATRAEIHAAEAQAATRLLAEIQVQVEAQAAAIAEARRQREQEERRSLAVAKRPAIVLPGQPGFQD